MTGILPVKKYGQHSALNMFWEYSMTGQDIFEEYTGFTESEVKSLCERFGMDFAETSNWYDVPSPAPSVSPITVQGKIIG